MTNGFDFQKQKQATNAHDLGVKVPVTSADGDPLYFTDTNGERQPVTITVAGSLSARARRVDEEHNRRPFRSKSLTTRKLLDDAREKVVACTMTWEGFTNGDEVFPFTIENVRAVYRECPWILDAVTEAMNDASRFTQNS